MLICCSTNSQNIKIYFIYPENPKFQLDIEKIERCNSPNDWYQSHKSWIWQIAHSVFSFQLCIHKCNLNTRLSYWGLRNEMQFNKFTYFIAKITIESKLTDWLTDCRVVRFGCDEFRLGNEIGGNKFLILCWNRFGVENKTNNCRLLEIWLE